jgi:hypothetical protein
MKIEIPNFSPRTKKAFKFSFGIVFGIFLFVFLIANQFPLTGKITDTEGYKTVPLNTEQRQIIEQSILNSSLVKQIPNDSPVFLRFFSFENGERVWQDGFLVGKDGIITQGEPAIYFSIHSKYIDELKTKDLCTIVKEASKNGDIGIHSDYSKLSLFIKYAGMIKYQTCFEF